MLYTTRSNSPVGALTLASDGEALTGLWIDGQKYFLGNKHTPPIYAPELSVFSSVEKWLDAYFAGEKPDVGALPLAPQGSEFARLIWDMLLMIPYGGLISYGQLAHSVAQRYGREHMSAQAVGGAVGHNPISIIIPCHRVVGVRGELTGYAGGLDKKIYLLRHEGHDIDLSRNIVRTDIVAPAERK